MLDYHGLAGNPADSKSSVAGRHSITPPTLAAWSNTLTTAGSRLPLSAELATEVTRRTHPGEDHLARTRIATTFGMAAPEPPPASRRTQAAGPSQADRAAAGIAARVLATVGPLHLDTLHLAIGRARRFRSRPPVTAGQLTTALTTAGATRDDRGRWQAPDDVTAPDRYWALVTHAAGRELTRNEMIAALLAAGYSPTSCSEDQHPSAGPAHRTRSIPDRRRGPECVMRWVLMIPVDTSRRGPAQARPVGAGPRAVPSLA